MYISYYSIIIRIINIIGLEKTKSIDLEKSDANIIHIAELLAAEFYPPERFEYGREQYISELYLPNCTITATIVEGEIIGVSTYKTYDWQTLKKQLYYEPLFENDKILAIRLRQFEQTLQDAKLLSTQTNIAVEMAYNLVAKAYRGNGIGKKQWDNRINKIENLFESPIIFTLARSQFSGYGIAEKTINYMLKMERSLQGLSEFERVNVLQIPIYANDMGTEIGVTIEGIDYGKGSEETIYFAKKDGFKPVGFSRNFSPVWAKQLLNR